MTLVARARARTCLEADAYGEAHEDDGDGVEKQEAEEQAGVTVDEDGARSEVDRHQQRHSGHDQDQEGEVLGEPGAPVQPVAEAHQLHCFLSDHVITAVNQLHTFFINVKVTFTRQKSIFRSYLEYIYRINRCSMTSRKIL